MCDLNNPEIQKMLNELRQSITNDIGISNIFEGVKVTESINEPTSKKENSEFLKLGNNYFRISEIASISFPDKYWLFLTLSNKEYFLINIDNIFQSNLNQLNEIMYYTSRINKTDDNIKFIEECKKTISNTIQQSE